MRTGYYFADTMSGVEYAGEVDDLPGIVYVLPVDAFYDNLGYLAKNKTIAAHFATDEDLVTLKKIIDEFGVNY